MRETLRSLVTILIVVIVLLCCFTANAENDVWNCPACGRTGNTGNYCGGCAHPAPWFEETETINPETTVATVPSIDVGNVIRFGHYEQDNHTSNGQEEIEWIVLNVQDNTVLLISKKILDSAPYNNASDDTTWKDCTLRSWLNTEFIDNAFSADELPFIVSSNVFNDGESNTQDKVFLLSSTEAFDEYFSKDESRVCEITDYAKSQGASIAGGRWWLRSPASTKGLKSVVSAKGIRSADIIDTATTAIRPALWMSLDYYSNTVLEKPLETE